LGWENEPMIDKKNFCFLPFVSGLVSLKGDLKVCCKIDQTKTEYKNFKPKNIRKDDIFDWWKDDYHQYLRNEFLKGNKPKECSKCWEIEAEGFSSLRQRKNKEYKIDWVIKNLKYLNKLQEQASDLPIDWEIRFTNLCNLKCQMCSGNASSKLLYENKKIFNLLNTKLRPDEEEEKNLNQLDYDFNEYSLQQLEKIVEHPLKIIHLRGGEPFMIPKIKKYLARLVERNIAKDILIQLTTNGTIYDSEIVEILKEFKKVQLMWSAESTEKQNDYLRYPSNWNTIKNNILNYSQIKNTSIYVSSVLTNYSVLYIDQIIKFAQEHNFNQHVEIAQKPTYLYFTNLPKELLQEAHIKIKNIDQTKNLPDNFNSILSSLGNKINNYNEDFELWNYFKTIAIARDNFRAVNMKEYMPELAKFVYEI
jgi:MoaA/NifB/PqqE/SkfB family radical SAM enzyme